MTKHYCDWCKKELDRKDMFIATFDRIHEEEIHHVDLCADCVYTLFDMFSSNKDDTGEVKE